jgi:hypothetical protein
LVAAQVDQLVDIEPIIDWNEERVFTCVLGFDDLETRLAEICGEQLFQRDIGNQTSAEIAV